MSDFASSALPAHLVERAVGPELASTVRAALGGYRRYALVDRGSYDFVDAPVLPAVLLDALVTLVAGVTGREPTLLHARALRLQPGDYVLTRHDRVHEDHPLQVVLDLSEAAVPDADVRFRHRGQTFFRLPPSPGALAIVERGPSVMCSHSYVTKRWEGPPVVRLSLLYRSGADGIRSA